MAATLQKRMATLRTARPNNSFKPTPHRGVNSVLCATLHAVATPLRGGLTQALGGTETMQQLKDFFDTATAFCKWAESLPVAPNDDVDTAIRMLSKLLALVHDLPEIFDEEDAPGLTHEEWLVVYKRFGALPFNYYASYSQPHDTSDPSPGIGVARVLQHSLGPACGERPICSSVLAVVASCRCRLTIRSSRPHVVASATCFCATLARVRRPATGRLNSGVRRQKSVW